LSTGGSGNTGFMWLYTLPGTMIILLGVQTGTWMTLAFFAYSALVLFVPGQPLLFTSYSPDMVRRFLPTMFTAMALGYIFKFMQSASQRKIVEKNRQLNSTIAELEKAGETIRESEEKYREIFENIQDIYFVCDLAGTIHEISPSVERVAGYSRDELLGRSVFDLYPGPEVRQQLLDRLFRFGEVRDYELLFKDQDGRQVPCEFTARLSRNRKGKPDRIYGTLRNIAERKRMEDELLKAQKLDSIGLLAGGIAHDFNNILTALMGNISFARIDTEPGSEAGRALAESEQACTQARHLTQQLLTFSRGGLPVKTVGSIRDLIMETAVFALRGTPVRCRLNLADDLCQVEADMGQLNQVLHNIVLNAGQAMASGGEVTVSAQNIIVKRDSGLSLVNGEYVRIAVRDEGAGIPEHARSRVFDPYFTTREKGSGLGLATAYSIIRNHKGLIRFDTRHGGGTTFFVYLPISRKSPEETRVQSGLTEGRGRILLMDDEERVRSVASRMISHLGYEVELTEDGEQAVEKYNAAIEVGQPFSAVILDLTVPGGMGGSEAIMRLKQIDPGVRAIVSSGYSTDAAMADYKSAGFCEVLRKPYRMEDLSQALARSLGT